MTVDDIISASDVSGWDIVLALLTLLATWIAFRLVKRGAQAAVDRIGGLSPNLRAVIVRVAKYLVLLLGVGIALTFLGAQLQPLLTVTIVVIGILALGLRGVAGNFGAGIIIQSRKPIEIGDEIESSGYVGVVTEMNGRAVLIRTLDGRVVHIPNADLLSEPLTNHSENNARRSEVQVRFRATGDVATAVRPLLELARQTDGVLTEPAPDVVVVSVESERLSVRLRFWHEPRERVRVTSRVVEVVGNDLRERQLAGTVTSDQPEPPLTVPPAV